MKAARTPAIFALTAGLTRTMCVLKQFSTPAFFLRASFLLASTAVLWTGISGYCLGQNSPSPQPELPKNAIWRFGEFGKSSAANGIYRLQYSRDGKLLAARNRKNIVSIFDVTTRKRLCEIEGHENNWVETIDFSPDGKYFVTAAGSSEKVKIWHAQTGILESEIDTDASAAYFNEPQTKIHVLGDTHVESYSWPGVQLISQRKWKSGNETRVGMSRDGRLVVSYQTLQRQIYRTQMIDLETRSKIQLDGPTAIPKTAIISTNRNWIAAAYHRDEKIRLWDLRDPHQKKYILTKHNETVQSLSFSDDNRFLVSSGWDEQVVVWDLLTRQPIGQFSGHTEHVNATAFAPLDLTVASGAAGTSDNSVIAWDLTKHLLRAEAAKIRIGFDHIWIRMGTNSLDTSLDATAQFMAGGDEFLDLLEQRIGDIDTGESMGTLAATLKLLEHPQWAVREKATEQLMKIRDKMDAELRRALEEATSPEVRFRISRVLKQKVSRPKTNIDDMRRWHRIIFALEQLNSDRGQLLLKKISIANPDVDIARDAKASLKRNERRNRLSQ